MDIRKYAKAWVGVGLGLVSLLFYLRKKSTLLNKNKGITDDGSSSSSGGGGGVASSISSANPNTNGQKGREGRQFFSVFLDKTAPGAITEEDKITHSMENWASLGLEQVGR